MPVNTAPPCCCKDKNKNFCSGCYPNLTVSPITVQIQKKPRYPPYPKANIKPINFDNLFPKGPVGQTQAGSVPCERCAKILREKEIQLVRKEQELFQLERQLRNNRVLKHDYGALREMEFRLRKRDQELTVLNMEESRLDSARIMTQTLERPTCLTCAKRFRQKELAIQRIEKEAMMQAGSPHGKINPEPCDSCIGSTQPNVDEKTRKKNHHNCFKELNKREKKLKRKEKDIDDKIKRFREENLEEAKENLEKTPEDMIKEVFLKCRCACARTSERKKDIDPCSFNPYAKIGSWACTMPFPMWNGDVSAQLHDCNTKCCLMKLLEDIVCCYCTVRRRKKKKADDTCLTMRFLRWWVYRKSTKCSEK